MLQVLRYEKTANQPGQCADHENQGEKATPLMVFRLAGGAD